MHLSEHFTLEELVASELAARHGIDNAPPIAFDVNLRHLADGLEAVRTILGNNPIHITSGYRPCHRTVCGKDPGTESWRCPVS